MQTVILVVLIGLIGGIAVGLQAPLASLIGQRLGTLESLFIVHLGGTLVSSVLLLGARGGNLAQWHSLPWYALVAGLGGLVVISVANFTIPRLGATTTIVLIVVGQLLIGLVIDHFGWLDTAVRPFNLSRLLGIGVLFLGIYLILK